MYTATMLYHFKEESFDAACELWRTHVMEHARTRPGFVRMQFLVARPRALAMGTWTDAASARRFMETGVFKNLLAAIKGMVDRSPEQTVWDLKYLAEK